MKTGFEIGKRYKTRDGEKTATLLVLGKTGLVFENAGGMYLRDFSGRYDAHEDMDFDFLPVEVREPRTVEGFVWVNEGTEKVLSAFDSLFGHSVDFYPTEKNARLLATRKDTRVAVKYKVTFEEIEK
jgi:hypothetical protein